VTERAAVESEEAEEPSEIDETSGIDENSEIEETSQAEETSETEKSKPTAITSEKSKPTVTTATTSEETDPATEPHPQPAGRPSRLRRWSRRVGKVLLGLWVLSLVGSLLYNALTGGRAALPKGLTYVHTGDIDTRYLAWGSSQAPGMPVVLLHGFLESSDTWSAVAPLLATKHRVEALDLRGFGYTQHQGPVDVRSDAAQLRDFLTARGLVKPLLVAHSSGAGVATEFALEHPDEVGGLLFLDGDALPIGAPTWLPDVVLDPWRTSIIRLAVRSDWLIRSIYDSQCGPACPPMSGATLDKWRRPLQVSGAEDALVQLMKQQALGLSESRVQQLRGLDVPKAVVFGAEDPTFPRDSAARTADRIGAQTTVLIPGARHLTMISNPQAVAAAVEGLYRH
jgi:pimeloyl-ACP methyl ester carboxylesterase